MRCDDFQKSRNIALCLEGMFFSEPVVISTDCNEIWISYGNLQFA